MGMYNVLFGRNADADVLLATLELDRSKVGRFRDVWVEKARLVVYTRNGGGNRDCWCESWPSCGPKTGKYDEYGLEMRSCGGPSSEECGCPGCIIEYRLPKHPLYLGDEDDEFDRTYARVFFSLPEKFKGELQAIAVDEPIDPSERWLKMIDALKAGS